MHFNGSVAAGGQRKVGAVFIRAGAFYGKQAALRVVQAFGKGQYQRQLVDGLPVVFGKHGLKELVAVKVAFGYAVVPASHG